jgi:hypothetical protein
MNRRRQVAAVVSGAALLAAIELTGWSLTHSAALLSYRGVGDTGPYDAGEVIASDLGIDPRSGDGGGSWTINSIHPLASGSLATSVIVCVPRAGPHGATGFLGLTYPAPYLHHLCRSTRAYRPGESFDGIGTRHQLLIAEFTMPASGAVRFRGATVRWHHGLRSGTQHVGAGADLTVGGPP